MATLNPRQKEEFQALLMKAVDNLLTTNEKKIFENYINTYTECSIEWQEFSQLKNVTTTMHLKEPKKEVWDMYWLNVYNRIERGLSWLLLTLGAVILFGYGAWEFVEKFFPDPNVPFIVKTGVFLFFGGLIALTISIIREKLFTRRSDPYKEVQR